MKTHMLLRINEGGTWKTVEGALTPGWSSYDKVGDCLHWQGQMGKREILAKDKVQVICVTDNKLAEFMAAESKGESTGTLTVQELVQPEPGWEPLDYFMAAVGVFGAVVLVVGIGVLSRIRWI